MQIFDLSQPLFDGCPNCPEHPRVSFPRIADHAECGWRLEMFQMASHSGTHLDAPLHKLAKGASIDQIPLGSFFGPARIADFSSFAADQPIGADDLARILGASKSLKDTIVLLNTGWGGKRSNSDEWLFHTPFLREDGARWLVERKIKGVGIDHFSVGGTRDPNNTRTHEILLGAGIWVVEDLYFREGWREAAANSDFQALPLLLPGFSGSPCRAVLMRHPSVGW